MTTHDSITDELREWAAQHKGWHLFDFQLNEIADRIDEEHEKMFADLTVGMAKEGWVKLPVDTCGIPWRIGDSAEGRDVVALHLTQQGWFIELDDESWEIADALDHVQPDSWESIIGDAADYGGSRQFKGTTGDRTHLAELVERCRRMAGDAE